MKLKMQNKRKKITILIMISIMIIPLTSLTNTRLTYADTGTFNENFLTTNRMDATYTNTSGWGEGNIMLPKNLEIIGSYDLGFQVTDDVFVLGNYAFVSAHYGGLYIFNVTDPSNPTLLSNYTTNDYVTATYVSGDVAYIADGNSGIMALNVSNPRNPYYLDHYDDFGIFCDIEVVGDYAYVASYGDDFRVIDVSNPTNLVSVGHISASGWGLGVAVDGDYAFLAAEGAGIHVIDISDPTNPILTDSLDLNGYAKDVYIHGNYAYLACNGHGLEIVDIADPTNIYEVAFVEDSGYYYHDVVVDGNYAYVGLFDDGVMVVNITDPTAPQKICVFDTPMYSASASYDQGLFIDGTYLYVADYLTGLQIISIMDLVDPYIVDTTTIMGSTHSVAVSGDYAYVANEGYGMRVYNISDPEDPQYVDSYDPVDDLNDVFVDGNYAYLIIDTADDGFISVDISDPTNPSFAGSCDLGFFFPERIFVEGNYAYVTVGFDGLRIVDISNPSSPSVVGTYNPSGSTKGVYVEGNYAYLASDDLYIVDVSDPTSPSFISKVEISDNKAINVFVNGHYCYVSASTEGLVIVDVTSPYVPSIISTYDTPVFVYSSYVAGGVAYVSASNEFILLDVSNPSYPTYIDGGPASYSINGLVVEGEYCFTADYSQGFVVYRIREHKIRQFKTFAVAQSTNVYNCPPGHLLKNTSLSVTENTPVDTSIIYYVSANGGTNWDMILPGTDISFSYEGKTLMWRSELYSSNLYETPSLQTLSLTYSTEEKDPVLVSPLNEAVLDNNTPTLIWEVFESEEGYWVQVDNDSAFTSPIINTTVYAPQTNYDISTPLEDGVYYWRIRIVHWLFEEGGLGPYSEAWTFTILTQAVPEFSNVQLFIQTLSLISLSAISFVILRKSKRK